MNEKKNYAKPKLNMDLEPYLPVILFMLVGVAVGVAPQAIGFLLGPRRPDTASGWG